MQDKQKSEVPDKQKSEVLAVVLKPDMSEKKESKSGDEYLSFDDEKIEKMSV